MDHILCTHFFRSYAGKEEAGLLSLFERGAGQMDNLVSEIQASNEVYDHQLCPLSHHALLTETRLFLKSLVGSIAVICVCCGIFVLGHGC